ncbi:MAG: hypothetical protein EZS28_026542 [Streblomastix strix]|uniref:Uncharacterized protein n=1 Tax=Streblomastix strix TaxID=222440 RepID=A0A5J4V6V7_9EUKA|nr:MAG: hypothetical protein EZS28_026542 [Streblomastix strix]
MVIISNGAIALGIILQREKVRTFAAIQQNVIILFRKGIQKKFCNLRSSKIPGLCALDRMIRFKNERCKKSAKKHVCCKKSKVFSSIRDITLSQETDITGKHGQKAISLQSRTHAVDLRSQKWSFRKQYLVKSRMEGRLRSPSDTLVQSPRTENTVEGSPKARKTVDQDEETESHPSSQSQPHEIIRLEYLFKQSNPFS